MFYILSYIILAIYFARVFNLIIPGWVNFDNFNQGSATVICTIIWPIPFLYGLISGQITFKRIIEPIVLFFKN